MTANRTQGEPPTNRLLVLTRRAFARGHRFAGNQSGAATIMTGMMLIVSIGFAAISIDGGNYFYLRRVQQTATDLAAVAAASNLQQSSSLAATSAGANQFGGSAIRSVELGTYSPDATLTPQQRFVTPSAAPNAVRVTMQTRPPFIFGGMLNILSSSPSTQGTAAASSGFTLQTRAVASNQDVASFLLGSGLAQLNGGIENGILGALIGSQLSLSVMDWQSLASANVDLFSFESALKTRAQLNAVTYSNVESSTVTRAQALGALADALAASGASANATAALAQLSGAAGFGGGPIPVSSLVSSGSYGDTTLTAIHPLTATATALDILTALLQISNGTREVQGNLTANIPGIASARFALVIGQPMVSSDAVSAGTVGTTLRSAQTRLTLTLQLVGSGPAALVNLPLYLELASSTARLSAVQCTSSAAQATLSVTPSAVDAWIGTVSDQDLGTLGSSPSVSNATFLNLLGVAQVTGRSHATLGNLSPTTIAFSQSDIAAAARKTTSTTDFTASIYASLMNNLSLNVTVLGGSLFGNGGLDLAVKQVLGGAASPVDQILNQVLSALGISVGNATTAVTGVQCGRSTLVN